MENLPYVTAALICERVIEEKDGTLSAIRIVDRATIHLQTNVPELRNVAPALNLTGLISIKGGPARGTLTVEIEHPSKETKRLLEFAADLPKQDSGQNIVLNLTIVTNEQGLHWFFVRFNGQLLSKIPLTIARIAEQARMDEKTSAPPSTA